MGSSPASPTQKIAMPKIHKLERSHLRKFYHASPDRLKIGTVLFPSTHQFVYLTNSPVPHATIFRDAIEQNWHIYEVMPMGDLWPGWCHDLICHQAEIIRYIGKAKGIASSHRKHFRAKGIRSNKGSYIHFPNFDLSPHLIG